MSILFNDELYEAADAFANEINEIDEASEGMIKIGSMTIVPNQLITGDNGVQYEIKGFIEFKIEPHFKCKKPMPCNLHKAFNDKTGNEVNCPMPVAMAYFYFMKVIFANSNHGKNVKAYTDREGNIYFK